MVPNNEGNTNQFAFPSPLPYGNQNILGFAQQNQAHNGILIGAGDGTATAVTGGIIGPSADTFSFVALTNT